MLNGRHQTAGVDLSSVLDLPKCPPIVGMASRSEMAEDSESPGLESERRHTFPIHIESEQIEKIALVAHRLLAGIQQRLAMESFRINWNRKKQHLVNT